MLRTRIIVIIAVVLFLALPPAASAFGPQSHDRIPDQPEEQAEQQRKNRLQQATAEQQARAEARDAAEHKQKARDEAKQARTRKAEPKPPTGEIIIFSDQDSPAGQDAEQGSE